MNGIFAIELLFLVLVTNPDISRNELTLSGRRQAVKPLLYCEQPGTKQMRQIRFAQRVTIWLTENHTIINTMH